MAPELVANVPAAQSTQSDILWAPAEKRQGDPVLSQNKAS